MTLNCSGGNPLDDNFIFSLNFKLIYDLGLYFWAKQKFTTFGGKEGATFDVTMNWLCNHRQFLKFLSFFIANIQF